jgi:hypothetical protein
MPRECAACLGQVRQTSSIVVLYFSSRGNIAAVCAEINMVVVGFCISGARSVHNGDQLSLSGAMNMPMMPAGMIIQPQQQPQQMGHMHPVQQPHQMHPQAVIGMGPSMMASPPRGGAGGVHANSPLPPLPPPQQQPQPQHQQQQLQQQHMMQQQQMVHQMMMVCGVPSLLSPCAFAWAWV